jgi:hypothetical protein
MTSPRCVLAKVSPVRWALTFWIILAAALCVKTALCGGGHSVYPQFAAASRHWWADKSLYDDYTTTEGIDGYRYSPAFAVAFTPMTYLPWGTGKMLWDLLSVGLLVLALHALARDVVPGELAAREGVFLTLAMIGSLVGIWSSQSNAVVVAAIGLAMSAIVRRRWTTAALLLAVPVFIKIWPVVIVAVLVMFWPRQLFGRVAAAAAALMILPFFTRPPDVVWWQYCQWHRALTGPLQNRWPGYRDAWTIWEQLRPPVDGHVYRVLQGIALAALLVWCWRQRRRLADDTGRLLMLVFSMWAAWQLFLGPGTEQLTYGLIAPSAAWAVVASFDRRRARWLAAPVWAALALLPSGDIERAAVGLLPAETGKMLLPLAVAAFAAWLVWHERRPDHAT